MTGRIFFILSLIWCLLVSGQTTALEVKLVEIQTTTLGPTTENEVHQAWTVPETIGETIQSISISLQNRPDGARGGDDSLVCRYRDERNCKKIWINAQKLAEPIYVALKIPIAGKYVLRMTTQVLKAGKKAQPRLNDISVVRSAPAETVYEIDDVPALFVTADWRWWDRGAEIRPIFGVRAKDGFQGNTPKATLTATVERLEQQGDPVKKAFVPLTCFENNGIRKMPCENIELKDFSPVNTNYFGVNLGNFSSAGKHHIALQVADPYSKPATKDIEISYRKSWLMALFLITFGVVVAFVAKNLISVSLPDLARRQKVADAARKLVRYYESQSPLDPDVGALAAWMNGVMVDAADGLRAEKLTDADVELLLEFPGALESWTEALKGATAAKRKLLIKASGALISSIVSKPKLDAFKAGITAAGAMGPAAAAMRQAGARTAAAPPTIAEAVTLATRINRAIRSRETILNLFIILIASITGLTTLWTSNPIWGQAGDCFAAFLWGAGAKAITDGAAGYLDINKALRTSLSGG